MVQYTDMFDVAKIKLDFPILSRTVNGKQLVYLDNAATTQKPQQVIDAIVEYYTRHNANVHRGVHTLSDESTQLFESSKQSIAKFFGAKNQELIFVRNTTEAINGVAYGWGEQNVMEDDVILVTTLDHHSNIVVWQELTKRKKAQLIFIGITSEGNLDIPDLKSKVKQFSHKIKLVALPHISNALGSVIRVQTVSSYIHSINPNIRILVDGAQSSAHLRINFEQLGVDFFAFSGHKMFAPMGIGGLIVSERLLQTGEMNPWLFGGGMISEVHESHTIFNEDISERFTAGTPDVASVVGLASACRYLDGIGMDIISQHDRELVNYALEKLSAIEEIVVVGPSSQATSQFNTDTQHPDRIGSVAFLYKGVHAHDVAQVLDSEGIAVRSGHHCTMPLHTAQNWIATTRISFAPYNSFEDIDRCIEALQKVKRILL